MKKIDLSFLKHKELPTKEIKVEIFGKEQEFNIVPINGRGLTSLGLIQEDDLDKNAKLCLLALIYGLKISQEEAELLMNADTLAADMIAAEVISFTNDYNKELNDARTEVKKNSKTKASK